MKKLIVVLLLAVLTAGMIGNGFAAEDDPEAQAVKTSIVIDLSNGYCVVPANVPDYLKEAGVAFSESEENSGVLFDIDGDGSFDMAVNIWSPFNMPLTLKAVATLQPGERGGKKLTVKPEGTNWLSNDGIHVIDITDITITTGTKRTIKEEYSVSVKGGYAIRYVDGGDQWIPEKVTKAAPGEAIYLKNEAPKGQYLKKWNSNIIRFLEEFPGESEITSYCFIMPSADVSFTAEFGKQKEGFVNAGDEIYYGGCKTSPGECFMQSILNSEWCNGELGCYDLDGDGTDDIALSPMWSGYTIYPCPLRSVNTYKAETPNEGPYWPVTADLGDGQYEITSDYILPMSISEKNTELLKKSLEAWQVEGRCGVYDLDKDGSEDFSIFGYAFLPSCSFVGGSVTIPASEEGIRHEIRFVCKEPSKYHHLITVVTENEGKLVLCNSDDTKYGIVFESGSYWEESNGVFIIPEAGSIIDSVTSDDVTISKEDWYEHYNFTMPSKDVTIRVKFRGKGGNVTPTVTPEPTPTVEPTPDITSTPEPTVAPTAVPTEESARGRDSSPEKEADSLMWLWCVAGIVFLAAAVMFMIKTVKKRKTVLEAKTSEAETDIAVSGSTSDAESASEASVLYGEDIDADRKR